MPCRRALLLWIVAVALGAAGCKQPAAFVCKSYVDSDDDNVADSGEILGENDEFNYGESITAVLRSASIADGESSLEVRMKVLGSDGDVKEERSTTITERGQRVVHFPLASRKWQPGKYRVVFSRGGGDVILARTEFEITTPQYQF